MSDIYNNGTYLRYNPGLHAEASEFKFDQMLEFLNILDFPGERIRILDVGGGAGLIGQKVADYFHERGYEVDFVAVEMSEHMIEVQRKNNPYIRKALKSSLLDCEESGFDLVLMIDVIEHVIEKSLAAVKTNRLSKYAIYNIPIEINLMDILRNTYMRGRYYPLQTESLGHVHFFSYSSCNRFIRRHHRIIKHKFVEYCRYRLSSDDPVDVQFRKRRVIALELRVSCWIRTFLKWFSPYLIQGSTYFLVETDG